MLDIVLESANTLILMVIFTYFLLVDRTIEYGRRGWAFVKLGLLFIIFGSIMDIADNFDVIDKLLFIGDTSIQVVLEKFVGFFCGLVFLAIGFWLWLPTIHQMGEVQRKLAESKRNLEYKIMERTKVLQEEVESRRRVEMALRHAEERRQVLYENAPIAIVHGLIAGPLVERNMAFAHMLGYDLPEDLSENDDPLHYWYDRESFDPLSKRLKSEKHVRDFETRLRHKDGSVVWVRYNFTTLADREGENYYFYGFANDITESKRAVDALAENEQRLKTIMNSLPVGMSLIDTATQEIVDVNSAALLMTGYSREELVGKHCCQSLCSTKNGGCLLPDKDNLLENSEIAIQMKSGAELPILKTMADLSMDGRKYLLEIFVDISEQKRLESLKEDVDRIVRHDLKSPIIGMINACTVLLMDNDEVQGEVRDMLKVILQQGKKVLRMIGMSLTMYKMESGTYKYVSERVDFMGVVRRVLTELDDVANSKGSPVNVLLNGKKPEEGAVLLVMGDELLYDSMLANLLKNAIEASPFGKPVELSLESGKPSFVTIVNSGAVPEDIRDGFFNKYVTSGKRTGTGLGTYSANLIARTVGATIEMDTSDDLDRTTVIIHLPDLPV
jgi:PAS domain S-box-containing protein